MRSHPSDRSVVLALYRDVRQLPCVERPGFAGTVPSVLIELSLQARLQRQLDSGGPGMPCFETPVLFAPTWRRAVPSLLQLAAEQQPEASGPVVLLCHTRDARYFLDSLSPVAATKLIWHPADRADHHLGELIGRVQRSPLGPSRLGHGLYLSSAGRPASAEDWQRTVTCPVLAGMSHRRRAPGGENIRSLEPTDQCIRAAMAGARPSSPGHGLVLHLQTRVPDVLGRLA